MYSHLVVDSSADLQDVVAIIAMYLTIVIISLMKQPIVGGEIIGLEIHRTIQCRTKRDLLQLFYLGLLQIGLEPSILYNSVHLYKIICCIYKVLLKYVYIQSTITYYSSSGSFAVETIFHGLQFVARPLFYARPKLRTISIVGQVITANSLRSLQKTIDNSYIYSSNTAQIWEVRNRQYELNMQRYGKKIASQDVQNFYSHLREEHSSTNPPFLLVIGSISHKGTSVCLLSPPSCIVYQRTKDELL